jgi:hypothetical protein
VRVAVSGAGDRGLGRFEAERRPTAERVVAQATPAKATLRGMRSFAAVR